MTYKGVKLSVWAKGWMGKTVQCWTKGYGTETIHDRLTGTQTK